MLQPSQSRAGTEWPEEWRSRPPGSEKWIIEPYTKIEKYLSLKHLMGSYSDLETIGFSIKRGVRLSIPSCDQIQLRMENECLLFARVRRWMTMEFSAWKSQNGAQRVRYIQITYHRHDTQFMMFQNKTWDLYYKLNSHLREQSVEVGTICRVKLPAGSHTTGSSSFRKKGICADTKALEINRFRAEPVQPSTILCIFKTFGSHCLSVVGSMHVTFGMINTWKSEFCDLEAIFVAVRVLKNSHEPPTENTVYSTVFDCSYGSFSSFYL